jgi:outer membrane beta-barrel protein
MKSLGKFRGWGMRLLVLGVVTLWLALIAVSWSREANAAGKPADRPADREDEEYNFSWLDPEKKIYVLQNRRYAKAQKFLLSVMGGPGFSNPYRNSYNLDPRLAYYLSEQFGFEVFYTATFNSENGVYQALVDTNSPVLPVVREIKSQLGALLHWSPWYAKINVFNKILYFDWYFSGGAGQVQTDSNYGPTRTSPSVSEQFFSGFVGTGHQYHLSDRWTVRLDFTGAFYSAPTKQGGDKALFPNYNFGIGLGARL